MKSKQIRSWNKGNSFQLGRLMIWPMVVAGWGLAEFAIILTVTHTFAE